MFSIPSQPDENLGKVCENSSTADLLQNSPKRSPRFSPGYESTENMFYFLIVKVFIITESKSVSNFNWNETLAFLKSMIKLFNPDLELNKPLASLTYLPTYFSIFFLKKEIFKKYITQTLALCTTCGDYLNVSPRVAVQSMSIL